MSTISETVTTTVKTEETQTIAFRTIAFEDTVVNEDPVKIELVYPTQNDFFARRRLTSNELIYVQNEIAKQRKTHEAARRTATSLNDHESITRANKSLQYLELAALQIDQGEYGVCGGCGATITVGRQLKCIQSPKCIRCKSE